MAINFGFNSSIFAPEETEQPVNDPPVKETKPAEPPKFDTNSTIGAVRAAEAEFGIPAGLLESLGHAESNLSHFNPDGSLKKSNTGATGIFQFTRKTAARYGIDRNDEMQNIVGAAAYLRDNYERFKTQVDDDNEAWLAAAVAHNRGEGAVEKTMIQNRRFLPSGKDSGNGGDTPTYATKIANKWAELYAPDRDTSKTIAANAPAPTPVIGNVPLTDVEIGQPMADKFGDDPIAKGVQSIQQIKNKPLQESKTAIFNQINSASDPNSPRVAVLFTSVDGLQSMSPEEATNYMPVETPDGLLAVNIEKARLLGLHTPQDVQVFVQTKGVAPLIGKVEQVDDTSKGIAVVTRDREGKEIVSSVVTTPEAAIEQMRVDKIAHGANVGKQDIVPVDKAIEQRKADVQADRFPAEGTLTDGRKIFKAKDQADDKPDTPKNYLDEFGNKYKVATDGTVTGETKPTEPKPVKQTKPAPVNVQTAEAQVKKIKVAGGNSIPESEYKAWLNFKQLKDSPVNRKQFVRDIEENEAKSDGAKVGINFEAENIGDKKAADVLKEYSVKQSEPELVAVKDDAGILASNAGETKVDLLNKPKGMNADEFIVRESLRSVSGKYGISEAEIDKYVKSGAYEKDENFARLTDADIDRFRSKNKQYNVRVHTELSAVNKILFDRDGKPVSGIHPVLRGEVRMKELSTPAGLDKELTNSSIRRERAAEAAKPALLKQAEFEVRNSPFYSGSDEEIQKRYQELMDVSLSDAEKETAENVGKIIGARNPAAPTEGAGMIAANIMAGVGTVFHEIAGISRGAEALKSAVGDAIGLPQSVKESISNDAWRKLSKAGSVLHVVGEGTVKDKGIAGKLYAMGGRALVDVPKLVALTTLTGGSGILVFAGTHLASSSGRGETASQMTGETAKGAAFGALLKAGGEVNKRIQQAFVDRLLPKATLTKVYQPKADIELASKIVGEAGKLGTIAGGTFVLAKASGADNETAAEEAFLMTAFDVAMSASKFGKVADLGGKVVRMWRDGEYKDVVFVRPPAAKGAKGETYGNVEVYDITGKTPEGAVVAEVVMPSAKSDAAVNAAKNVTPRKVEVTGMLDGAADPLSSAKNVTPKKPETTKTDIVDKTPIPKAETITPEKTSGQVPDPPKVGDTVEYTVNGRKLLGAVKEVKETAADKPNTVVVENSETGKSTFVPETKVTVQGVSFASPEVKNVANEKPELVSDLPAETAAPVENVVADLPQKTDTIKKVPLKTQGAELLPVKGTDDAFEIKYDNNSLLARVKNVDFPNQKSVPTRGEIFSLDVKKKREGVGTAMMLDALTQLKANGAETVKMTVPSKEGRPFIESLVRRGMLSEPIQTSESGTTEYRILVDENGNFEHPKGDDATAKDLAPETAPPVSAKQDVYFPKSAVTAGGTRVSYRGRVIDDSDIITSFDKGYPQELQPRNTSRVDSKVKIVGDAAKLDVSLLGDSPNAGGGAPKGYWADVEIDGKKQRKFVVITRNHGTESIREAKRTYPEKAKEYEDFARSQHPSGKDVQKPVYVHEIDVESVGDLAKFAIDANVGSQRKMSDVEQAQTDSKLISAGLMSKFVAAEDGSIHSGANRDFIRGFLETVVNQNERGALQTETGELSQTGLRRIKNAIFARAFGDTKAGLDALGRMAESTNDNVKNITNALLAKSGDFADLKTAIADGTRFRNLDITSDIAKAAQKFADLKSAGTKVDDYLNQGGLFEKETTPFQDLILTVFDKYSRNAKAIRTIFDNYVDSAHAIGNPNQRDLLGNLPEANAVDTFTAAVELYEEKFGKQTGAETGLFADAEPQKRGENQTSDAPISENETRRKEINRQIGIIDGQLAQTTNARGRELLTQRKMDYLAELNNLPEETKPAEPAKAPFVQKHISDIRPLAENTWLYFDKKAFENTPNALLVPVEKLISEKDQSQDKKYLAGTKNHPVYNAYSFFTKAGQEGIEARKPILARLLSDGNYRVLDGNATTQAAKILGWKELPIKPSNAITNLSLDVRDKAETVKDEYFEDVKKAAPEVFGTVPEEYRTYLVKTEDSLLTKLEIKSTKVPSDLVRTTIIVPAGKPDEIATLGVRAVEAMGKLGYKVWTDEKGNRDYTDRFTEGAIAGYLDINIKFIKGEDDFVIRELQLIQPAMAKAKDEGHKDYDEVKKITKTILNDPNLSPERIKQLEADRDELNRLMELRYNRAFQEDSAVSLSNSVAQDTIAAKPETDPNSKLDFKKLSAEDARVILDTYTSTSRFSSTERAEKFLNASSADLQSDSLTSTDIKQTSQLNETPNDSKVPAKSAETMPEPEKLDYGTIDAPNVPNLAKAYAEVFGSGKGFSTIVQARKFAAEKLGGKVETGSELTKTIDEAIEVGVVIAAREIANNPKYSDQQKFAELLSLYEQQPPLSTRSSTSILEQAYSTPAPLAFVASKLAGITKDTSVYEPSGGNGMLLVEAEPDSIVVNELNKARNENLKTVLGDKANIQNHDAATWKPDGTFDVVIMNPPFGTVKTRDDVTMSWQINPKYQTNDIDHAIAFKALQSMKPDGRAVLIVGGVQAKDVETRSDKYNGGAKRKFYYSLYNEYNVIDHFTVSGDLYSRQGASYPVDIIVINGRGQSNLDLPAANVPRIIENYDDLGKLLESDYVKNLLVPRTETKLPDDRPADVPTTDGNSTAATDGIANGNDVSDASSAEVGKTDSTVTTAKPRTPRNRSGNGRRKPAVSIPADEGLSKFDSREPAVSPTSATDSGTIPATGEIGAKSETDLRSDELGALDRGASVNGSGGNVVTTREQADTALDNAFADIFGEPAPTPKTAPVPTIKNESEKPAPVGMDKAASLLGNVFGVDVKLKRIEAPETPPTDDEIYHRAKEGFLEAYRHFENELTDTQSFATALVKTLHNNYGFPKETLLQMKPYLSRFITDVENGVIDTKPAETPKTDEDSAEVKLAQAVYVPASGSYSVNTLVPANMQTAVSDALADLQARVGNVDDYVRQKLGYADGEEMPLSAEATDAIALAISNIEKGAAFIIGDQTGIGKGRMIAGVLRYARNIGATPIFVTEKPNLYADIVRDLVDIRAGEFSEENGLGGIRPLMTNSDKKIPLSGRNNHFLQPEGGEGAHNTFLQRVADEGDLMDYDMLFTTYNQLQTVDSGKRTVRHDVLESLIDNAIIVFDESHNAGGNPAVNNAIDPKTGLPALNRATFIRQLTRRARGVFFSSGTFAKRPDVMDLYARTDISKAVSNLSELPDVINEGGVPLQQAVSSMLARAGQYLRREKTWDGIEYNAKLVPVDKQLAAAVSNVMRAIDGFGRIVAGEVTKLDKQAKKEAKRMTLDGSIGSAGVASTNFTSLMHNLVSQMLLGLKVPVAAQEAIEALQRGEKPVITLASTMGSFIESYVTDFELNHGDAIDLDFGVLLKRYLERSREITEGNAWGDRSRRYLEDEDLGETGVAAFNSVMKLIEKTDWKALPASPIDFIKNEIRKAGYTVGEITGRSQTIDYGGEFPTYMVRPAREIGAAGRNETINRFNSGAINAIILNQAGSTGISLHASNTFENVDRRHMIVVQAELNIDTHMQMMGRTNRTGQVEIHPVTGQPNKPRYTQLVADVPAEKRPAAVLGNKMAKLNANTTAARDSALTAKDVPDFINEYGDEIAAALMEDNPDLHRRLGMPVKDGQNGLERKDAMRKVTGRIPLLPLDEQEIIYEQLENEYADYLQQQNAMGENRLEAKSYDLDAVVLARTELFSGDSSSPFTEPAYAEQVDIKRLGKPFSSQQVGEQIGKSLGREINPDEIENFGFVKEGEIKLKQIKHDAVAKFDDYRKSILDEIDPSDAVRLGAETVRLDAIRKRFIGLVSDLGIGAPVKIWVGGAPNAGGVEQYAVITKFEQKGQPKNPLALGTWRITFAVADSTRQLVFPLSKLYNNKVSGSEVTSSTLGRMPVERVYSTKDENYEPIMKRFDEGRALAREKRFIVTGNILAGYARVQSGQIISYTTQSGEVRQGILMPRNFNLTKTLDDAPVVFKTPEQVTQYLDTVRAGSTFVGNADNSFRVQKNQNGEYLIVAPKAKNSGGYIFLNKDIIQIAGRDFIKVGNSMVATVAEASKVQAIIRYVETNFTQQMLAKGFKDVARNITGEAKAQTELIPQDENPNLKRITGDYSTYQLTNVDIDYLSRLASGDAPKFRVDWSVFNSLESRGYVEEYTHWYSGKKMIRITPEGRQMLKRGGIRAQEALRRAENEASAREFHQVKFTPITELTVRANAQVQGSRVKVNLEGQELLRRVMEENDIRRGVKKVGDDSVETSFSGLFLDREQLAGIKKTTADLVRDAKSAGADQAAETLAALEKQLEIASLNGKGTAVVYMYDSRLPHEVFHQASYLGAMAANLMSRHSAVKELRQTPAFKATANYFSGFAEYQALKAVNPQMFEALVMEETGAYIEGGERELLGISETDAVDYMYRFYNSYVEKNAKRGEDGRITPEAAKAALAEFKAVQGSNYEQIDRTIEAYTPEQRTTPDAGSVREQLREPETSQKSDVGGDAPKRTEQKPTGGEPADNRSRKLRRLPVTLRRAKIEAEDLVYDVQSDVSAKSDAVEMLEKLGIAGAIDLIDTTVSPDASHAQLAFMVAQSLENRALTLDPTDPVEAAAIREVKREFQRDLATKFTRAGQFISAARVVQNDAAAVIETAEAIAKTLHNRKTKSLTPEELEEFTRLAEQNEATTTKLLEVRRELRNAKAKIARLEETKQGKTKEPTQKAREARKQLNQIVAEKYGALVENNIASVRAALGLENAPLKAVAGEPILKAVAPPTLPNHIFTQIAQVGAQRLIVGLGDKTQEYLPDDFQAEMTALFGNRVVPDIEAIHHEALNIRKKWLAEIAFQKQKQAIGNKIQTVQGLQDIEAMLGRQLHGNLTDEDVFEILNIRRDMKRRRNAVERLHSLAVGFQGKKATDQEVAIFTQQKAHTFFTDNELDRTIIELATDDLNAAATKILSEGATEKNFNSRMLRLGAKEEQLKSLFSSGNEKLIEVRAAVEANHRAILEDVASNSVVVEDLAAKEFELREEQKAQRKAISEAMKRLSESRVQFALRKTAEVSNASRTLMASGDLSAGLRQGGWFTFAAPELQARSYNDMIHAFGKKEFGAVIQEIEADPKFIEARRAELEFAAAGEDSDFAREETYKGQDFLSGIKFLGIGKVLDVGLLGWSERTYTAFLDSQRMTMYGAMARDLDSAGMSFKTHPEEYKQIAKFINVATGKGVTPKSTLGKIIMDLPFFAPRYALSRFQLLNMTLNPVAYWNMPPAARNIIARSALRFYGTIGIITGIAAAFGLVTMDDDDPDFAKIKIGNTSYDLFAGTLQPAKILIKTIHSALRTKAGFDNRVPHEFSNDLLDTGSRFVRGKLSPPVSFAWDAISGEDYLGNEFQLDRAIVSRITPLTFADMVKAYELEGEKGSLKTFPSFFGIGAQTYERPMERASTEAEVLSGKMGTYKDKILSDEEKKTRKLVSELTFRSRKGEDVAARVRELFAAGTITETDRKNILSAKDKTYLQDKSEKLPLEDLRKLEKVATPIEKEELAPLIKRKEENEAKKENARLNPKSVAEKLKRADTDKAVELFEEYQSVLNEMQVREFKAKITEKANRAGQAGTLTQEEIDRVKRVVPEFQPRFKPAKPRKPQKDTLRELGNIY